MYWLVLLLHSTFAFAQPEFVFHLNSADQKRCEASKTITFFMRADGVAIDGERPVMKIAVPCSKASTVRVSLETLRNQKPRPGEFVLARDQGRTVASVDLAPPQWPRRWVLEKMQWDAVTLDLPLEQQLKFQINW